jgi:Cys-tRNA(Pro)/Cys-tRNA(Cys) deacylase
MRMRGKISIFIFFAEAAFMEKTNVMRILDRLKIKYSAYDYSGTGAVSGVEVADALGFDRPKVFKTLVTAGKSGKNYVFIIPVAEELDLKKAAVSAGEKSIEMIKSKELLPLTGYIHGGCSPIGMKKLFTTVMDISAEKCGTVIFSAGKIGYQVETSIEDLKKAVPLTLADVCV